MRVLSVMSARVLAAENSVVGRQASSATPGGVGRRVARRPTPSTWPGARMSDIPYFLRTQGASMTRSKPFGLLAAVAVVPLVALVVAGCGSNDNSPAAAVKPASGSATVSVANTGLGKIL